MILILSEKNDESTCHVIDWLSTMEKSFFRINAEDTITFISLSNDAFAIKVRGTIVKSEQISCFWYRKGPINGSVDITEFLGSPHYKDIKTHLSYELQALIHFVHRTLNNGKHLSSHFTRRVNKLEVLQLAKDCGLHIPDYVVTSELEELRSFVKRHKNVITKPLDAPLVLFESDQMYMTYTENLDESLLNDLPNSFVLSAKN